MSNALATVRFTLDIPEEKLVELVGPDDGDDSWFEAACEAAESYIEENLMDALDAYGQQYAPEIECER